MALVEGSRAHVIANLNRYTQTPLDWTNLTFSALKIDDDHPQNVKLRLTALPDYVYRGTYVVGYQRLSLNTLPGLLFKPPRMSPSETLYDLLPEMTRCLGIRFSTTDVEDAPVVTHEGGYKVKLKARPMSYQWTGECDLVFADLPPLSIPLNETTIRW